MGWDNLCFDWSETLTNHAILAFGVGALLCSVASYFYGVNLSQTQGAGGISLQRANSNPGLLELGLDGDVMDLLYTRMQV